MSDVMLHGVLNMPPYLWSDSPIDIAQRHGRYVEASKRIKELELELSEARKQRDMLVEALKMFIEEQCEYRPHEHSNALGVARNTLAAVKGTSIQ